MCQKHAVPIAQGDILHASPGGPAGPARPSAWPALAAYLAAFLLALVLSVLFVFGVAYARAGSTAHLVSDASAFAVSPIGLMSGALVNAVVLGGVALVAARLQGRPVGPRLRLGPSDASWGGAVAATTGMVGLSVACGALRELVAVPAGAVLEAMSHALESPSPAHFVLAVLTIGVAPGLAEETFFRGLMQTRLVASWGRWPAIVATAAAFGLLHLDPVQGGLAFVAGIFLGWVAERLGGIRPTIVAHAINNAAFVAAASVPDEGPSRRLQIALVVAGAVAWAVSLAWLRSPRAIRSAS
jgi:membrane protease YdiL (CAAX protease family)